MRYQIFTTPTGPFALWESDRHGLRTEPSGAITTAAVLSGQIDLHGEGDLILVLSGRNVDEQSFQDCLARG